MNYRSLLLLLLAVCMSFLSACVGSMSFHVDENESLAAGEAMEPTDRPQRAPAGSLVRAANSGDVAALNRLLREGGDPNELEDGRTPLMEASYHDHAAVALALLANEDIDPNKQELGSGGHRTALMTAAAFDSLEVVRVMVSKVDVNFKSDTGVTALIWAAANSSDKAQAIIEALLESPGIDLEVVDNKGRTAYMVARANNAGRSILEKLHFEGCAPTEEAVETDEEAVETDEEVDQQDHSTGRPFRQVGNVNLKRHEHEGDIDITDLKIVNTFHGESNEPLPNQTGNINLCKGKTTGTITISGSTMTNTVHYGGSPDAKKKSNE